MTENNKTMVTVFESKDFGKVRTVDIDNKIYFCGSDVARRWGMQDQMTLYLLIVGVL